MPSRYRLSLHVAGGRAGPTVTKARELALLVTVESTQGEQALYLTWIAQQSWLVVNAEGLVPGHESKRAGLAPHQWLHSDKQILLLA